MNNTEQIILIVEKCLYGDHDKCDCAEKINAILERVRQERDTEIVEMIENLNEPSTNIMTVCARNEIVLILEKLKTGNNSEELEI